MDSPAEYAGAGGPKQCGKVAKALFEATRAADAWLSEVRRAVADVGMETGGWVAPHCPSAARVVLAALACGGDFLIAGRRSVFEEILGALGRRCHRESVGVGPRKDDAKELLSLSRWAAWG